MFADARSRVCWVSTAVILDEESLAHLPGEIGGNDTGDDIRAARSGGHDDFHRLDRLGLRQGNSRDRRKNHTNKYRPCNVRHKCFLCLGLTGAPWVQVSASASQCNIDAPFSLTQLN